MSNPRKAVLKPQGRASTRMNPVSYGHLVDGIADVLEAARRTSSRAVNALMTATYWEIGRRIVAHEQRGKSRAGYGEALIERLSQDLTARFGRGFSVRNVSQMRAFYLAWPILQTVSAESDGMAIQQTPSATFDFTRILARFPLPWSAYVRLLSIENEHARTFYETEALRAGWSVRQLDRQIQSQFYERTALSRNKTRMLAESTRQRPGEATSAEQEIKDPYVLEFLNLRDEYSESDLESALIHHLETFLLELGNDFCFVGRQRRLRIGDEWYRVDLLFYHRRLRCLMLIDLKLGRFTHADAGQMHTYLNYAAEHWSQKDENPPVGLILCAQKEEALARYALDNLPNKVLAAEYRTVLPDEGLIAADLQKTRRMLEHRSQARQGTTTRRKKKVE